MDLLYPQGYSIDPQDCSAQELAIELQRFSFRPCGMQHEATSNAIDVVTCSFTADGFNLGCAHHGVRTGGVDAEQYIKDAIQRLRDEKIITYTEFDLFNKRVKAANDILYIIDVLQRNSQPERMVEYPDWQNSTKDKPRQDSAWVKSVLAKLDPESLLQKIIQRCYDSFETEKVGDKYVTTLQDPLVFQTRIKIAQLIAAHDLVKIVSELRELCLKADFVEKYARAVSILNVSTENAA